MTSLTRSRSAPPPSQDRSSAAQQAGRSRNRWALQRKRIRRDRVLLVLAVPGILLILLFKYVPLLGNVTAFQDYQPYLGFADSEWVGLQNFSAVFADPNFWNSLKNTAIITVLQVVFVFPAPIILALLLNSLLSERIKKVVQSILYLPHFLSWVMVVAICQQLLGGAGVVNNTLRDLGMDPINVIGNSSAFYGLVTLQVIWKDTGWATILFLAALAQIDNELYEAASVDGAGRWRQMWHITLPGLKSIIILLLILRLGEILTVGFEQILLQQPAVGLQTSEVLDTYVYNNGILSGQWGQAAAVGLIKGVVGVLLVVGANKTAHIFGEPGLYQK